MFQILINGTLFNIGQPLPTPITSVSIIYPIGFRIPFHPDQRPLIEQWFNTLIDNCTCEWIVLNDTFYRVDELNKFPSKDPS